VVTIAWSKDRSASASEGRTLPIKWEAAMHDHVYKVIDLVGSSETSIEDAINTAITRAAETVRNLRWFEVVQTRGQIENGKVHFYQAVLKVGFTMEEAA
jgi:dodecin